MKKIFTDNLSITGLFILVLVVGFCGFLNTNTYAAQSSGSLGLEGKISAPPPTQPATISLPRDGTTTSDQSVTITGICPNNLLVKIFKNNVFSGSAQCNNGSFSIKIDLFNGLNEIVARVYDDLDQAGPDSNIVKVTVPTVSNNIGAKISLTSSFAKKGATPGEKLTWPISLSGGTGPYAISVDWGDGKTPDIMSQTFAGTFNIEHVYENAGVYNVVVRATDKDGNVAFLQLVGVGNGQATQQNVGSTSNGQKSSSGSNQSNNGGKQQVKILWQPAAISIPLIFSTFYLGRKYELFALRKRLEARDDIR